MFELMKIRHFLLSVVIFLIIFFTAYIFFMGKPSEDDFIFDIIGSYILLGLFPFVWFLIQFRKSKQKITKVINRKGIYYNTIPILLLTIVLLAFSLGIVWLSNYLLAFVLPDYVKESLAEEGFMPSNKIELILLALNICLIGPIAEEFIFRGLLFKRLGTKMNTFAAALVSSLAFGIFHFDIIGSFVFGIIMIILYQKCENLFLPIILHVLYNTVATVVDFPDFTYFTTIAELHEKMLPNLIMLLISSIILLTYLVRNVSLIRTSKTEIDPLKSISVS